MLFKRPAMQKNQPEVNKLNMILWPVLQKCRFRSVTLITFLLAFKISSLLIVVWIKFLLTICEFTNLVRWYFNLIFWRTSKDNFLIHTLPKCIICSGICRTLEGVLSINLKLRSSLSVAEPYIKCIKSDSTVSFGFLLNKEHFKKSNYVTYYWSSRALHP